MVRARRISIYGVAGKIRSSLGIRVFLVSAYRYALRVEAYIGLLTNRYPPLSLAA